MISRYPLISHTFVQREVLGLREAGFEVETFSVVRTDDAEILSPLDRAEAERTVDLRPAGPAKLWRHLVRPVLSRPGAVLGTARVGCRGWWSDPRQLLWRLFYVAEAVMLWSMARERGIGHLHAHHANVASNLAWLACEMTSRVGAGPKRPGGLPEGVVARRIIAGPKRPGGLPEGVGGGRRGAAPSAPEGTSGDTARRIIAGPKTWSFTMHGSSEFVDVARHDLGAKAEAATAVACISDYTRSQLMMVSDPESWPSYSVVHCGVDTDVYAPAPDATERRADDPFTVLFVGRLGSEKGLPVLVDAMAQLQRTIGPRRARLLVVGDGELREPMAARCAELGVDAEFVGSVGQHEILPLYHRADAFCMTSFREGIPVVLMEAMACQIPCVAPRITAIPELIEEGITGLTATAGRADMVAAQLERYALDPDFAREVGKAAREKVLAEFTTEASVAGMVEFFDRLLAP